MSSDNDPGPAGTETPGRPASGQPGPAGTETPGQPGGHGPRLQVRDPKMMRALAHPLRVALIEAVSGAETQTLTATQASELLGESPANCAFHLRTLAKYGFLEEAGGGRGRERPWRLRYRSMEIVPPGLDQETLIAAGATASIWMDRWVTRARDRLLRMLGQPVEWQEAAIGSQRNLYLTAQEAKALGQTFAELLEPYQARWEDRSLRPPGSVRYEVLVFGYPLTDPPQPPGPTDRS